MDVCSSTLFISDFSLFLTDLKILGQDDLLKIAREEGEALPEEEQDYFEEETDTEEERHHYEIASKFMRFFTHNDQDHFWLFVECGVQRTIHVRPVFEHTQLELTIEIPAPSDDLFHFVGIKRASEVAVEATEETIYIEPPRKLSTKKEVKYFYPNAKTPLFLVFEYEMEIPVLVEEVEVKIDNSNLFFNANPAQQ